MSHPLRVQDFQVILYLWMIACHNPGSILVRQLDFKVSCRGCDGSWPLLRNNAPCLFAKPLRYVGHGNIAVLLASSLVGQGLVCPNLAHEEVRAWCRLVLRVNDATKHEMFPAIAPLRFWTVSSNMWLVQIASSQYTYSMDHLVHKGCSEEEIVPKLRT